MVVLRVRVAGEAMAAADSSARLPLGEMVALLVASLLVGLFGLIIVGNFWGYRDSHARRIIDRATLRPISKILGPPNPTFVKATQILVGMAFIVVSLVFLVLLTVQFV